MNNFFCAELQLNATWYLRHHIHTSLRFTRTLCAMEQLGRDIKQEVERECRERSKIDMGHYEVSLLWLRVFACFFVGVAFALICFCVCAGMQANVQRPTAPSRQAHGASRRRQVLCAQ